MNKHINIEQLENILESISDGFFILDNNLVVTYFNKPAEKLLGRKKKDILGKNLFNAFPEAKNSLFEKNFKKAINKKIPLNFEVFFKVKPYINWYDVRVYPFKDGISVFFQVTTERKNNESKLKESEEKFRNLFKTMEEGVVYQNADGKIISVNPAACRLLGISYNKIKGKTSSDPHWRAIHEDGTEFKGKDHPSMVALKTGKIVKNVIMGIYNETKKHYIWININAVPIFKNGDKKPYQVYTTFNDITDRKNYLEKLSESEKKWHSLFDNMFDAFALHEIMLDKNNEPYNFRFIDVNPAFENMTGLKRKDVIGKTIFDIFPDFNIIWEKNFKNILSTGKSIKNEYYFNLYDKYFEIIIFSPEKNQFATIFTDITEKKKAELERQKIIKQLEDKNAELEKFTYTVSHDLKSPIVTIKGFIGMLKNSIEEKKYDEIDESLKYITIASDKVELLLKDLLKLAKLGYKIDEFKKINMKDIINKSLDMLKIQQQEKNIKINIMNGFPEVMVDSLKMEEVYQNLIENAIKFSKDTDNPKIDIGYTKKNKKYIYYVKDNGIGIDPKYKDKIFNIFDKLDNKTDGSGIGLAIVKRIIKLHTGEIWLESKGKNKGTVFYFTLNQ